MHHTFFCCRDALALKYLLQCLQTSQGTNADNEVKMNPESTLVDLYDPNSMLPDLKKAHTNLDREVEKLYRTKPFESDNERAEFLLSMYLKMIDKT